ncbi:MAG: cobalamin biosynthesis protein [Dehalococcoidales bacterium]|nr:cobalamin biosynthesis protein [Dehalococcoidales bacterium]
MESVYILILAMAVDLTLGEPPNAIHPVAWIGKVSAFLVKIGAGRSPVLQFVIGLGTVMLTCALFVTPVYFVLLYLKSFNFIAYIIVSALILKTCFSLKELRGAALRIRNLLEEDKQPEARFELRALVARNTGTLDKSLMISATVESVAENSCDSFFAPLFYYLLLGVPGAIAYRVINTLDAMIGYHGEYEYLGKFAARLDTVVNYIPARIAALLLVASAGISRRSASSAWRIMLRDRKKTESPNAGWTMSAMAGALGVQLEKVGYYKLGDNRGPLVIASIDGSLRITLTAAFIWGLIVLFTGGIFYGLA